MPKCLPSEGPMNVRENRRPRRSPGHGRPSGPPRASRLPGNDADNEDEMDDALVIYRSLCAVYNNHVRMCTACLVASAAVVLHAISTLSIAILVFVMLGALVSTVITRVLIGHYANHRGWAAATILHGRFFVGLISSLATGFVACCRYGLFTHPIPFEGVVIVGLKVMLSQFYRHVQGFHWEHRLIIATCIVACFLSCPAAPDRTWSVLGWQSEVALMTSCLCLGELLGFCVTGASANARLEERTRSAEAHRLADSRLNHLIKGHCGGTKTILSLYMQMVQPEVGDQLPRDLQRLLGDCQRHMDAVIYWCHRRQTFLRMEQGTYESVLLPLDVLETLGTITLTNDHEHIWVRPDSRRVAADEFVLRACIEEAISNARAHSPQNSPIQISARLVHQGGARGAAARSEEVNGDGVTTEADDGTHLLVSVTNSSRPGEPPLTSDQCCFAFRAGYTSARSASESTSDGLGLETVAMMARVAGGRTWLEATSSPGQRGNESEAYDSSTSTTTTASSSSLATTTFHLSIPARRLPPPKTSTQEKGTTPHIVVTTNAQIAPVPFASLPDPATPLTVVTTNAEIAPVPSASLPDPCIPTYERLKCVAIDDDGLQREILKAMLKNSLSADPSESCVVGGTGAEQDRFVELAMGVLDARLQPVRPADQREADVAIIDHRLQQAEQPGSLLLGTDLAFELQQAGFRGAVCLYTAESGEDGAALARMPGVDAVFEKGVTRPAVLVQRVREIVREKRQVDRR